MSFSSIQGQSYAIKYLQHSLQQGRIAHAFLFAGPEGVGKRATAKALAQAMNCLSPVDNDACGVCTACRKIENSNHPDVHWIIPDSQTIKIEQIRESLQREAVLKPLEGKTKLYILDPADSLTLEAANSLLKLLEEPPANVVIILVTSQPFSLLETIRSRCQEIRFHPVERRVLTQWLSQRLNCSPAEAITLAMLSGGRPAEALRLADPDQKALRDQVLRVLQTIQPGNWAVLAEQLEEQRSELPETFMFMLSWYRDLFILASGGDEELVMNRDRWPELQTALQGETPESLQHKCQSVLRAMEQLKRNINVQLLLENMFIQLGHSGRRLSSGG